MRIAPLRKYDHPDLSDYVIHFVSRVGAPNKYVDDSIQKQTAPGKLFTGILGSGQIRAFPPFFSLDPVVCFTECTPAGVETLIRGGRYDPWGVAFPKDFVFQHGGGPAFYVRGDEWEHVSALPQCLRARATKLWPGVIRKVGESVPWDMQGNSEWTHEREWRVAGTGEPPAFHFDPADVAFVVIGDWGSSNRKYRTVVIDRSTGTIDDPDGVWIPPEEAPSRLLRRSGS